MSTTSRLAAPLNTSQRWLIHHLCEVCLLRALYLHTKPATNGATR